MRHQGSRPLESSGPAPDWLTPLAQRWPAEGLALVHRALALVAPEEQLRADDPVARAAVEVGAILADLKVDPETLAVGVLAPAVRDGRLDLAEIARGFGHGVAELVGGGAKLDAIGEYHGQMQADAKAETEKLRRMLLALVEDVRVVVVKLAERVQTMRHLKHRPEAERVTISRETMDIYAPLANRLGMGQVKWELEDLAFRFLEPATYSRIARLLDEKRVDREVYIKRVVDQLAAALAAAGVAGEVTGRPKHIFSIWKKMQHKGVDFHELFDVRAIRVLVNDVAACYAVLGLVHTLWQPVPKEFDDYIAHPKPNLYQSLHTAVIGPAGKTLEVQIRTIDMHRHAELGVAAHWLYKEGGGSRDRTLERKVTWLRRLLDPTDTVDDADLLERLRSEAFEDQVYVLTPRGRVVDLPSGATPLDFAYQVHTEIGHRCRGAKVDGRIVPLTYELRTGEQVEILTAKESGPSRDWLSPYSGYLKTAGARAKVRQWFNRQELEKNAAAGRSAVERELKRLGVGNVDLAQLAKRFNLARTEELFAAVGRGDIGTAQIAGAVQEQVLPPSPPETPVVPIRPSKSRGEPGQVRIHGVGNLLTTFAQCCRPVPPDPIIGFITRGRGVTVHRCDCPNVLNMDEEQSVRLVEVSWGDGSSPGSALYPVEVHVEAVDRQGLLRDIANVLSNEKINVLAVNTGTNKDEHMADMRLTIEVRDAQQLSRALDKIGQVRNVLDVGRVR